MESIDEIIRTEKTTIIYLPPIFEEECGKNSSLYIGNYIRTINQLLKEGLTPISPAQLMDIRNKIVDYTTAKKEGYSVLNLLWQHQGYNLCTGWGVADKEEKVYLFPNCQKLLDINNIKIGKNGYYIIELCESDLPKNTIIFNKKDLRLDTPLTKACVNEHPILFELAEKNNERLNKYVENLFNQKGDYGNVVVSFSNYSSKREDKKLNIFPLRLGQCHVIDRTGGLNVLAFPDYYFDGIGIKTLFKRNNEYSTIGVSSKKQNPTNELETIVNKENKLINKLTKFLKKSPPKSACNLNL